MRLHKDKKIMAQLLRATSERYNIKLEFVEKDYWVTYILHELSNSSYVDMAIFKGGTSLSKGYRLISRFSEDVDLALCHSEEQSGNNIKTLIRTIEKSITAELTEVEVKGVTSKGSRFRKSVFQYDTTLGKDVAPTGSIIVEINSFANPYPFVKLEIESFVATMLREIGQEAVIEEYDLEPFTINVLDKRQTLIEKLVSLVRFSHLGKVGLASKIRHFYDIHALVQDAECREYIASNKFTDDFNRLLLHDKEMFADPAGWQDCNITELPLFNDTARIWEEIAPIYSAELQELAFVEIPTKEVVLASFQYVVDNIKGAPLIKVQNNAQ